MRLAYVCDWNAKDPNANSGAAYGIRCALIEAGHEVYDIFPVQKYFVPRLLRGIGGKFAAAYKKKGLFYSFEREPAYLEWSAKAVDARLRRLGPIDAVVSQSSVPITRLRTKAPVYVAVDQSFRALEEDYRIKVAKRHKANAIAQTEAFIRRSAAIFVPSEWAAQDFRRTFAAPADKLVVAPWGANLPATPEADKVAAAAEARVARLNNREIDFLFIGSTWERKGGTLIAGALERLRNQGYAVKLHIVGKAKGLPEDVPAQRHGFINKFTEEGFQQLEDLLLKSHFYFMPSNAEAFGHTYCEAAAFGIPSIAADVGGVSAAVIDGVTGVLLSADASSDQYAAKITECLAPSRYLAMSHGARQYYETTLNWNAFASRLLERIQQDAARHAPSVERPATALSIGEQQC
jgi:glycosyltransferase involved in cell wall biosynthesis